ncbi:unnamed protein product [Cladocopium goreaui]|uniref:Activator of Hsp90 ATPase AHSA1-like N-terminal domain-containing protein n=1 Tax=Cladocopium goreaui TaxID=2562237 RepID=A0A9P1BL69_9DINO|nr:unnamed protein product [Cladocopium goreaui]
MAGEGDVMMSPDQADQVAQKESPQDTAKEPEAESPETTETKEPKGPTNEERVAMAESSKEAGNVLLKAGDAAAAVSKYAEGIELTEPLLEKDPGDVGEELQKRGTALYLALRLNSAQANIKQSSWLLAIEHASKVLLIEKDNTKALYRRSLAGLQLDTEGRLEEARGDLSRLIQLEPSNREAREMLFKVKERLKELRQQEKERLSAAMKGGLYQEQHKKLGKLQAAYEEEVKRLKDAGEDEISFEDFAKKTKEKEEELEKKQKEEAQKRREEERQKEEERQLKEENRRRASEGKPSVTMEEWRAEAKAVAAQEKKRVEEVVKMDEAELDEEGKRLLPWPFGHRPL